MDELIAGMKYYCSDVSEEKAREYSKDKKYAPCTWDGTWFVSSSGNKLPWKYWVSADRTPIVTTPYKTGEKYMFKDACDSHPYERIYLCTIGGRHLTVAKFDEAEYPNGNYDTNIWDSIVETDDVTEMTMEQVSCVLREKGVITGTLKIKE